MNRFLVFISGLIFGSFYNVIICRLPEKESIVKPPSHCPKCGERLKVLDLIPVLSFIIFKAKCRYCGEKISWQYPLVEVLTACLFLALYCKYTSDMYFFITLLLISLLIISSVIDIKYQIIPNVVTYSGIITGIILSLLLDYITIKEALMGLIIPALFLYLMAVLSRLILKKEGMGMGDVKLAAMIGVFLGWELSLAAIFAGAFIGSFILLPLQITGVLKKGKRIPFGPMISLGAVVMIFYGELIINFLLYR